MAKVFRHKLQKDSITLSIENTVFLVAIREESFNEIVRSNETRAFILDYLKEEIAEKIFMDAMCAKYNAPRETIAADVKDVLSTPRWIGTLEE